MNAYEEYLYCYIMDNKFQSLRRKEAYRLLAESRDAALEALEQTFTAEQRVLYLTYEAKCNAAYSAEMRHLFHKAFRLGLHLAR